MTFGTAMEVVRKHKLQKFVIFDPKIKLDVDSYLDYAKWCDIDTNKPMTEFERLPDGIVEFVYSTYETPYTTVVLDGVEYKFTFDKKIAKILQFTADDYYNAIGDRKRNTENIGRLHSAISSLENELRYANKKQQDTYWELVFLKQASLWTLIKMWWRNRK